jgi:peptide/nickel transport system ATP-binding protein
MSDPVLSVEGLSIDYLVEPVVHAVKDVSFTLHRGEVLGLAGESGCGKSTLAYGIARLLKPPAEIVAGKAVFHSRDGNETDWQTLDAPALRAVRWDQVSIVFQGAMNSLNPVISIRAQLEDVFTTHRPGLSRRERRVQCAALLSRVGVDPSRLSAYPHELSGGMRQRVMIAMAMALSPQLMIMDEPTTALDVVVQKEILAQITELREQLGFSIIFITHDLSLLVEIADRIAIMYAGQIVELAPARELFTNPLHPYTQGLMSSFPALTGPRVKLTGITGSPPDLRTPPSGCRFHPRCSKRMDICPQVVPQLAEVQPEHWVACHLFPESTPTLATARRAAEGALR